MIEALVQELFNVRVDFVPAARMQERLAAWPHSARYIVLTPEGFHISSDVHGVDPEWGWLGFTPITAPTTAQLMQVFETVPLGALGLAFIEPKGDEFDTRALYFRVQQAQPHA